MTPIEMEQLAVELAADTNDDLNYQVREYNLTPIERDAFRVAFLEALKGAWK